MTRNPASFSKTTRTWIFLCTALALLIAVAVWRSAGKAMQMKSEAAATGQAGLGSLKPGGVTKIVIEVMDSSARGYVEGKLLEKQTETTYARTNMVVEAAFDTNTSLVMGKTSDIRPGAILHITGTIMASRTVQARQIVVLTGYVQVR